MHITRCPVMFTLLRLLPVWALWPWLIGGVAGCDEDIEEPMSAALLLVVPGPGRVVLEGSTIRLSFDRDPGTLRASRGTVGGSGVDRSVTADAALITLWWDNGGSATLRYRLVVSDASGPVLLNSTPARGASNVNPAAINTSGIVLESNKCVGRTSLWIQANGGSHGTIVDRLS